jgi:DNA-binding response OmpR family regulator
MIKVVVVDDDTDLLDMVCLMLDTPGISPYCFDDCLQVMPVLEAHSPHVLVMDIFLGACDGRTLCKQVKAMEKYASLPVILYSAGEITEASIRDSKADYFLRKPFDMQVLLDRIQMMAAS